MLEENKSPKQKIDWQLEFLKRHDSQISTTNVKASVILSLDFAAIAMLSYQLAQAVKLGYGASIVFLILILAIVLLFSAFFALQALNPNTKLGANKSRVSFVGIIKNNQDGEQYFKDFKNVSDDALLQDLCAQSHTLAGILNQKYRYLSRAIVFAALSVFVTLLSLSYHIALR